MFITSLDSLLTELEDKNPTAKPVAASSTPIPAIPSIVLEAAKRSAKCLGGDARLSKSPYALLDLLIDSEDGMVEFTEACDEEFLNGRRCPWPKKGVDTLPESRKSTAYRLSRALAEEGIPYRVTYSECTNLFSLIYLGGSGGKVPVSCVKIFEGVATKVVVQARKTLRALKSRDASLQKSENGFKTDDTVRYTPS